MEYIKNNPRRSLVFGCYILAFAVFYVFLGASAWVMTLVYLLITLVFAGVFHADCAAVLGNIYFGRGKARQATVFLRYAIKRDTKVANAYVACAMMLMQAGREQAVQAAPLLEKAFALTTNRLLKKNLVLTRASCQWLMGDTDHAIALLEQMRKDYEYVNDKVYSTLGFLYFLKGDDAQAQALSQKALDDNPNAHSAWDNLGQIYYKQGAFEQAKQAFDQALECKADLPDSLYHMGLIARREGDEGRARAYFDRALACKITGFNTVTKAQIEQAAGGL